MRNDPGDVADIEGLVAICRSQVHPLFRMGMLLFPAQLSLRAQLSVSILVRECDSLRRLLLGLTQGKVSMSGLTQEVQAGQRSANMTLNPWANTLH